MPATTVLQTANAFQVIQHTDGVNYVSDVNKLITVPTSSLTQFLQGGAVYPSAVITGKDNISATTSPAVTDDTGHGYSVGSVWVDVTNKAAYTCTDPTLSAAIWVQTGGLTFNTTTFKAGTSGLAGEVDIYPVTASKGKRKLVSANNAADYTITETNASFGQSTTITMPDPGAASAEYVLSAGASTIAGVRTFSSAPVFSAGVGSADNLVMSAAAKGLVLKRGANGRCGTFVANGVTPVTVSNTSVAVTDAIIISLNTVGGTVGAVPAVVTITGGTGFNVAATASDTSTYNYTIISNAA